MGQLSQRTEIYFHPAKDRTRPRLILTASNAKRAQPPFPGGVLRRKIMATSATMTINRMPPPTSSSKSCVKLICSSLISEIRFVFFYAGSFSADFDQRRLWVLGGGVDRQAIEAVGDGLALVA